MSRMNILSTATKQRHLSLLEKMKAGRALTAAEIKELEKYEMAKTKTRQEAQGTRQKAVKDKAYIATQTAAAKYAHVDVRTIRRWQTEGLVRDVKLGYLREQLTAYAAANGRPTNDKTRKDKAEADYREAKARLAQIELDIKEGRLVEIEAVKRFMIEQVTAAKRRLLGVGQKVALRLSVIDDPAIIATEIKTEIEESIELLAREFTNN
jgi:uncharacterized protein with FMN-binding domain